MQTAKNLKLYLKDCQSHMKNNFSPLVEKDIPYP